jgi:hypothetical protein
MAEETRIPEPVFQAKTKEATLQELADLFSALAIEYVLRPTPDGLDVLKELVESMKPSRDCSAKV